MEYSERECWLILKNRERYDKEIVDIAYRKVKNISNHRLTKINKLKEKNITETEKYIERIEYLEELIDALQTYYSITVEDLENCIKNDK